MALPKEYEEASRVDGATSLRTFRKVVFPLLRPVTGTVAIFTGLIIWNDFFLSLIFLNGTNKTPLPVAVYTFVGAFASRWNLIFAAVIVSLAADASSSFSSPSDSYPRLHRRDQDLGEPMATVTFSTSARSIPTARARSPTSTSRSTTASSWSSSGLPAAARRPRCGWSPASRTSPTASSGSATGRQRPRAAGARHRDGLPELRALPAHERVRQHRLPAARARGPEGGDPERV